jgi:hypothetical protein
LWVSRNLSRIMRVPSLSTPLGSAESSHMAQKGT